MARRRSQWRQRHLDNKLFNFAGCRNKSWIELISPWTDLISPWTELITAVVECIIIQNLTVGWKCNRGGIGIGYRASLLLDLSFEVYTFCLCYLGLWQKISRKNIRPPPVSIFQAVIAHGMKVDVRVTPYQISDDRRPWIGKEEKKFSAVLFREMAKGKFRRRLFFDEEEPCLENHFKILETFEANDLFYSSKNPIWNRLALNIANE